MPHRGPYHLFVYGSLRSGFRNPAYEYISRYFNLVGDARVKGVVVDMGTFPAAVPFDGEHYIVGELYVARNPAEFAWAIGQLDDYEGVGAEADEVPLYRRELVNVSCHSENYPAWIYWYNGDVRGKPVIESGDVLEYHNQKLQQ